MKLKLRNGETSVDRRKAEAAIEAILFAMGEAVEIEKIAKAIEQDKETTRKIIYHMMEGYREEGR